MFDPQEMVARFRQRAEAVRTRGMPPIEGPERQRFREQAQRDFTDYAMIGDADAELVDGILTLRIDLRPKDTPAGVLRSLSAAVVHAGVLHSEDLRRFAAHLAHLADAQHVAAQGIVARSHVATMYPRPRQHRESGRPHLGAPGGRTWRRGPVPIAFDVPGRLDEAARDRLVVAGQEGEGETAGPGDQVGGDRLRLDGRRHQFGRRGRPGPPGWPS